MSYSQPVMVHLKPNLGDKTQSLATMVTSQFTLAHLADDHLEALQHNAETHSAETAKSNMPSFAQP